DARDHPRGQVLHEQVVRVVRVPRNQVVRIAAEGDVNGAIRGDGQGGESRVAAGLGPVAGGAHARGDACGQVLDESVRGAVRVPGDQVVRVARESHVHGAIGADGQGGAE